MQRQFEIKSKYIMVIRAKLHMSMYHSDWDGIKEHYDATEYLLGDAKEEELNLLGTVIATPDPFGSDFRTWYLPLCSSLRISGRWRHDPRL